MTSRTLQTSRCPTCNQPTLEGLDDTHFAQAVHIDPTPTTPAGELLALATGRTTYDVIHQQLEIREPPHITPRHRYPIHAQHACDTPPLPAAPGGGVLAQLPDDPPF